MVVQGTGDNGLVGVAIEVPYDNFLTDTGQYEGAPLVASPGLAYPQPTAAVLVLVAFSVPMELHFHPTVGVGVDFFSLRARDYGGLNTYHSGVGGGLFGVVGIVRRNGAKGNGK